MGDPGACTSVSLHYLIDELDHGLYTRRTLPRYLQDLLTVCAGTHAALVSAAALPPPAPRTLGEDGQGGGGCRGRGGGGGGVIVPRGPFQNDRDGEVIPNPVLSNVSVSSVGKTREGCARTWPYPPEVVSPSAKGGIWGTPFLRITGGRPHISTLRGYFRQGGSGNGDRQSS